MSRAARPILAALVLVAGLAGAAPAAAAPVLVYDRGELREADDPHLPPRSEADLPVAGLPGATACAAPAPAPVRPAAGPSVKDAIAAAERRKQISAEDGERYRRIYSDARETRNRISNYKGELASVIGTLEAIAGRGQLTASRMPPLFLQLRRNTEFWSGNPTFPPRYDAEPEPCEKPAGRAGARIEFADSRLVFQYYPGRGLQLQPLANWGKANGIYTNCRRKPAECDREALRGMLDEMVATASRRGGFTTWEYWFSFGGGTPPWTSGLSQGTAIQALARGSQFLGEPSYLRVARSAVGAFSTSTPVGVRVKADGGNHYAIYSFSPGLRVLNGFLQALVGLHDYASVSKDARARSLFKSGDRRARRELPRYDTGAWSLYSEGGAESTLGYHRLVTGFLSNLCSRTKTKAYCAADKRFTNYLRQPPKVRYGGPKRLVAGRAAALRFSLNKVSCVTAIVKDAEGREVYRNRIKFARGGRAFTWRPRSAGRYTLTIDALDLRKNRTVATAELNVARP